MARWKQGEYAPSTRLEDIACTPRNTQKPKSLWQRAGEWSRVVDWEKGKENECKV
jgi:hypothetical protein